MADEPQVGRFSQALGRSRYVVLLAVIAVMLVAVSLFLLGAVRAVIGVYSAWEGVVTGDIGSTALTVEFLEIVSVMLKAVVFYMAPRSPWWSPHSSYSSAIITGRRRIRSRTSLTSRHGLNGLSRGAMMKKRRFPTIR